MKLRLIVLATAMVMVAGMQADNVTLTQARQKAEKFFVNHGRKLNQTKKCIKSSMTEGNATADSYYIFNAANRGGYVIVGGEDQLPSFLAYSTEGEWPTDEQLIPDALKNALRNYDAYVEAVRDGKVKATKRKATEEDNRIVVGPLLTTNWNQTYPYNIYAPECPDTVFGPKYNGHFPIGCAAVALGQVINYWKDKGAPLHPQDRQTNVLWQETEKKINTETKTLSSATTYDYAHIPDTIGLTPELSQMGEGEWATAADAVGTLLRDVAYSLNMKWTFAGGGGALDDVEEAAAILGMGMSFDAQTHQSMQYIGKLANPEWWQLIQNDLDNGRPIPYGGQDKGNRGGHAFVLDGYDTNHFVHVNWGWGGSCNNWFDIQYLKTNQYDEREKSDYDFASANTMVNNLHPRAEGEQMHTSESKYALSSLAFEGGNLLGDFKLSDRHHAKLTIVPIVYQLHAGLDFDMWVKMSNDQNEEVAQIAYSENMMNQLTFDPLELSTTQVVQTPVDIEQDIAEGDYNVFVEMRGRYGDELTDWFRPNVYGLDYDSLRVRVDSKHIITGIEAYDSVYLDSNCFHHFGDPDEMSSVMVHTYYSQNPNEIIADSLCKVSIAYDLALYAGYEPPYPFEDGDMTISLTDVEEDATIDQKIPLADVFDEAMYCDLSKLSNVVTLPLTMPEGKYILRLQLPIVGMDLQTTLTVIGAVAIDEAKQEEKAEGKMYNLQGMQVDGTYKGIVIQNGKKLMR